MGDRKQPRPVPTDQIKPPPPPAPPPKRGMADAGVQGLIAKWRAEAEEFSGSAYSAVRVCADELERALASPPSSCPSCTQWKEISTAPKDGSLLLTFCRGWDSPAILTWWGRWDDLSGDSHQDYQPSHWMPLPSPPVLAEDLTSQRQTEKGA